MHWQKVNKAPSTQPRPYHRAREADIEMTAYALMTYVLLATDDRSLIGQAMPIVRWLTKQRNGLGGFASTQVNTLQTNFSNGVFLDFSGSYDFCLMPWLFHRMPLKKNYSKSLPNCKGNHRTS